MTTVKMADLLEGLEFSSFNGPYDCAAYVCRETGRVYCLSEDVDDEEDLPDDLDSSDQYLPLPDKRDLELGQNLVRAFIEEASPADYETVVGYFRKSGAYGQFKNLLARRELLDSWHAYERAASESALREWCAQNGLQPV